MRVGVLHRSEDSTIHRHRNIPAVDDVPILPPGRGTLLDRS